MKKIISLVLLVFCMGFLACGEDLSGDLDSVEKDTENIQEDVDEVKTETTKLQTDMDTVKKDTDDLETDMETVKSDSAAKDSDIDWLTSIVESLQTDMTNVKSDVAVLQAVDPTVYTKVYEFDAAFLNANKNDIWMSQLLFSCDVSIDKIISTQSYYWSINMQSNYKKVSRSNYFIVEQEEIWPANNIRMLLPNITCRKNDPSMECTSDTPRISSCTFPNPSDPTFYICEDASADGYARITIKYTE